MTPVGMGLIVSLAAAGAVLLMASLASAAIWCAAQERLIALAPRVRARALATLRLLPATLAVGVASIVFLAFIRLEPTDAREVLGFVLPGAALATVVVFARRATHAYVARRQTTRAVATWQGSPPVVDVDFPIVAVVGIWRPRLYVARRVVETCDCDELDAIIAHERAHVSARDNVTRACFLCTPFAIGRVASQLELAWTRASEEAADDAARCDERSSLALASALTKVARLAVNQPMPLLHASAIFSGSSVAERVQRILDSPCPLPMHRSRLRYALTLGAASAGLFSLIGMRHLHDVAEYCVRYLP
jgi:Zn-dependent protease with chaperone function